MAEPTCSRETLRRSICRKARMEFYRRYPAGSVPVTAGAGSDADVNSVNVIYSSYLTQKDAFWNNQYVFIVDTAGAAQERRIAAFDARRKGLTVEWPLSSAASSSDETVDGDSLEITSIWSPTEIHDAINDAIQEGYKHYPDIITDNNLIVQEDKLVYDLSGLATQPHVILKIWIEQTNNGFIGGISDTNDSDGGAIATTQLRDTNADLSALSDTTTGYASSDWLVSIYNGPGMGEHSEVFSVDTATCIITASSAFSASLSTTSKYRVWNPKEETDVWYRWTGVRFDANEEPSEMYFKSDLDKCQGLRIKLEYVAQCATLTADSDETQVPKRYILNKSLAYLHDAAMHDNRASRQDHATLAQAHDDLAEQYAAKHPRRWPSGTIWTWEDADNNLSYEESNPMSWG